jgi:hypothetical protein
MRQENVPQDAAILDQWHEISYAVDAQGRYVLTPSAGWDAANLANLQAWQTIAEEIRLALETVRRGQASPLLFHMARHQMDVPLLASYLGVSRWRVRRHLQPKNFQKLSALWRSRYADIFRVPVEALAQLPDRIELPVDITGLDEDQGS